VPPRHIGLRVLDRDEREQAFTVDDVLDELDRALLPDCQRRHRLREDDSLLERQDRQLGRNLELFEPLLGEELAQCAARSILIETFARAGLRSATGSVTVSSPRRYSAVAPAGSIGSVNWTRRWKGPSSISMWKERPRGGRGRTPAATD